MYHESKQTDSALFDRLCPPAPDGSSSFAPIMHRRLAKLGISKTNPSDLTPEEKGAFARLDIDPATITWVSQADRQTDRQWCHMLFHPPIH